MFKKFFALWRRWIFSVSVGFADQAVLSGVNFLFNVLLVRWLLPNEYGVFAVAFSIFLFISGFQNALILQPASVVGVSRYNQNLPKYFGAATAINNVFSCALALLLLVVSLILLLFHSPLAFSFLSLAIATPFILSFWLFRQICYIQTRPGLAWRANIFYTFFLMGGALIFNKYHLLSPFNAFMIMASSSLLATLFFWRYLGIDKVRNCVGENYVFAREILVEHWRYGSWVAGSGFVSWLSTVSYLPLVGILVGLEQAGAFRAMQNLILPLERVLSVFALLLIPWISKNKYSRGEGYVKNRLFILAAINLFVAGAYGVFLLIWGDGFSRLLYGQSYAVSFTWLLPYFAIVAVLGALVQVLGIGLKILERTDLIFWAESISTILTLTVGLYLVIAYKLQGAALGLLVSTAAMFLTSLYFLLKYFRRKLH